MTHWTPTRTLLASLLLLSAPALADDPAPAEEPAAPEGDAAAPEEEAAAPEGDAAAPKEEPAAPEGDAAAPNEEPAAPEGDAAAPEDEPAPTDEPAPKEEPAPKAEPAPDAEPSTAEEAAAAPAEACPEPRSTADLRSSLELAQSKFSSLDVAGFQTAIDSANADLPCLSDKLTRNLAAEYHRFRGLEAFVDKDPAQSTLSFAAARSIEPGYRFPESFVPPGNPVLAEYSAIDIDAGESDTVGAPKVGRIEFDGRESLERATSWPTLVQLFADDGSVTYTGYLTPGDALPEYDAKPIVLPDGSKKGPNMGLLGGGIGGVLLSGVFYGLGASSRARWSSSETPVEDLDGLRSTTNAMQTASIAAGIVGVGLTGTSFVIRTR